MNTSTFNLSVIIALTLLLGEAHCVFYSPEIRDRSWFLLSDRSLDIEWYAKFTGEALAWIVFIACWLHREVKRHNKFFAGFLRMFLVYRVFDLVMFWVNMRQSGWIYTLVVYGIMTAYIAVTFLKWRDEQRS